MFDCDNYNAQISETLCITRQVEAERTSGRTLTGTVKGKPNSKVGVSCCDYLFCLDCQQGQQIREEHPEISGEKVKRRYNSINRPNSRYIRYDGMTFKFEETTA